MLHIDLITTDVLMRMKDHVKDVCRGIDRYGNPGISGPRLDNWALIRPPRSKKIVQSEEKNHSTSYQRAVVHILRCRWR